MRLISDRYHVTHILITEQVPAKLGHTDEAIMEAVDLSKLTKVVVSKTALSGTAPIKQLQSDLGYKFDQIICTGAEAHICILKTVPELLLDSPAVQLILVKECVASIVSILRPHSREKETSHDHIVETCQNTLPIAVPHCSLRNTTPTQSR